MFLRLIKGLARFVALALVVVGLANQSYAATNEEDLSTSAEATAGSTPTVVEKVKAPTAVESKFFGTLDTRAEYYAMTGTYDTSNFVQFGYQFNNDFKISWYQGFDSNLSKAKLYGTPAQGLNPIWDQGFLRTRINNIWKSGNGNLSLNYESRIYIPSLKLDANSGNVTRLYNALKFVDKVNDTLTLTAVGVVSPQIYNVAGTAAYGPNPWLETRFYLIADINFTDKLSLDFPFLAYQDKYRNYGSGSLSGNWGWIVYIWPELDYAINDTLTVGVAYITDNWVTPDLSSVNIGHAFKNSIVQFVVTVNL